MTKLCYTTVIQSLSALWLRHLLLGEGVSEKKCPQCEIQHNTGSLYHVVRYLGFQSNSLCSLRKHASQKTSMIYKQSCSRRLTKNRTRSAYGRSNQQACSLVGYHHVGLSSSFLFSLSSPSFKNFSQFFILSSLSLSVSST